MPSFVPNPTSSELQRTRSFTLANIAYLAEEAPYRDLRPHILMAYYSPGCHVPVTDPSTIATAISRCTSDPSFLELPNSNGKNLVRAFVHIPSVAAVEYDLNPIKDPRRLTIHFSNGLTLDCSLPQPLTPAQAGTLGLATSVPPSIATLMAIYSTLETHIQARPAFLCSHAPTKRFWLFARNPDPHAQINVDRLTLGYCADCESFILGSKSDKVWLRIGIAEDNDNLVYVRYVRAAHRISGPDKDYTTQTFPRTDQAAIVQFVIDRVDGMIKRAERPW